MALNFDELPKERPNNFPVLPNGKYPGITKKAEMRKSKAGAYYMVVTTEYTDPETGTTVTVFDNFYTSDKPLNKFKIRQFLTAINIKPIGDFELSDVCKVIPNKKLGAALKIEKSDGYPDKNIVDVFDDEIYYKADAINTTNDDDLPFSFDAEDSADDNNTSGAGNY